MTRQKKIKLVNFSIQFMRYVQQAQSGWMVRKELNFFSCCSCLLLEWFLNQIFNLDITEKYMNSNYDLSLNLLSLNNVIKMLHSFCFDTRGPFLCNPDRGIKPVEVLLIVRGCKPLHNCKQCWSSYLQIVITDYFYKKAIPLLYWLPFFKSN